MRKKHLKKRHFETWPTKEREARFILRSLAAQFSKRKRHDKTRHDTTRHDTTRDDTHTHTRTEGTGTHNQKGANAKNRNYEMYSRSFFKIRGKQLQQNIKTLPTNDQQSIKNESRSSTVDPSGQRPVFEAFFDAFWSQNGFQNGATNDPTSMFLFACFSDTVFLRFLSDKW